MDSTTLTLTITSLVLSLLAAAGTVAQAVWTRRATTRVFSVEARFGFRSGAGLVHRPTWPTEREAEQIRAEGYREPVVGVIVRNTGALPLVVQRWSVVAEGGMSYVPVRAPELIGPTLPHQVPAGGSADWWSPADNLLGLAAAATVVGPRPRTFRVQVECGDGTARTSRRMTMPGG